MKNRRMLTVIESIGPDATGLKSSESIKAHTYREYRRWSRGFRCIALAFSLLFCLMVTTVATRTIPDPGYSYISVGQDNTRHTTLMSVQNLFQ